MIYLFFIFLTLGILIFANASEYYKKARGKVK